MVTTSPIIKTRCSQTKEKQQEQEQLLTSLSFETTSHTQQQKTIVHFFVPWRQSERGLLIVEGGLWYVGHLTN